MNVLVKLDINYNLTNGLVQVFIYSQVEFELNLLGSWLLGLDQSESSQMLLKYCELSGQLMFFDRGQYLRKINFQTDWEQMPVSRPIFGHVSFGKKLLCPLGCLVSTSSGNNRP